MLQYHFTAFPVLQTERLLLRETTPADVEEVFFLRADNEVLQYINKPPAKGLDDARAHILSLAEVARNGGGIWWAIAEKGSEKMIGTIGVWNLQPNHYRAEIGYVLYPNHHRKGIMNEAMAAALQFAFQNMGLHSLEAHIHPENIASQKLLEKNQFRKEGHFRENYFYDGQFLDSAVYSLLAHDWEKMTTDK